MLQERPWEKRKIQGRPGKSVRVYACVGACETVKNLSEIFVRGN